MPPLARACLVVLCLAAGLGGGGRALAHAQLVAADPAEGAVLAAAPDAVRLRFSEPVRPLVFRWFPAGAGAPVAAQPSADGGEVTVPVPPGVGRGTLLLSWRVVSADGHPVGGSHAFAIGAPTPVAGAPAAGGAVAAAIGRGLLTLALVVGVGGAVFALLVDRATPPARRALRLARWSAAATPPIAVLALGLGGLDLGGAPPGAILDRDVWAAALTGPFVATAAASALAGLLALAALRASGRGARALALVAWGLAAASFALTGHAASASPRWLTVSSVALHAGAVLFWIGALPGLAERAARPGSGLVATLRRFSAFALPLVAGLVVSGAALAVVQVRAPAELFATAYGRLLCTKLAFVAVLLGLAALNRWRLTPAIARAAPGAAVRFRRSVAAEIGLGLVILALASGFRLTPPPRALLAVTPEAYVHLHGPTVMADVTLKPGKVGANAIEIGLQSTAGGTVAPLGVEIAFSLPAEGVEPLRLNASGSGDSWHAGPVVLPRAGVWTVRLDVLVSDFDKASLAADLTVRGP